MVVSIYKRSKEVREKMRERMMGNTRGFKKGQISLNKGKKASEELRERLSKAHLGKKSWNKGRRDLPKHTEEWKRIVSEKLKGRRLSEEHKRKVSESRKGIIFTERHKKNISLGKIGRKINCKRIITDEERLRLREIRRLAVTPQKNSSIEIKIQNFLKQLHIEFYTHQYMHINHGYQCDIYIPSIKTIIECDGCYWHGCPICQLNTSNERIKNQPELDDKRTKELEEKGYKVIRLWEHEIRPMTIKQFENKIK